IPIFLLAAIGLWLTWRRRKGEFVAVYLVLGSTVLLNMLLYSSIRFRAPIEPLLVILAAAGLTRIPWRTGARRWTRVRSGVTSHANKVFRRSRRVPVRHGVR